MTKHEGTCYQLQLQQGVNYEGVLFRVHKGDTVRFTIDSSLQGQEIYLFINHPTTADQPFDRHAYRKLSFKNPSPFKHDTFDIYAELAILQAGSFNFHVCDDKDTEKVTEGYIVVDPEMHGLSGAPIPLDGLIIQTYLTKSLGKLNDWPSRLECAYHGNYNMVHLTPVQELGKSQSSYCLRDQLTVNPAFSDNDHTANFDDIAAIVKNLQTKWGIQTITDLVFNHTANESPWIKAHPECGFNLVNSPHLRPAYLLDRIVWQLTLDIANGKLVDEGIGTTISDSWQLGKIEGYISNKLKVFKLHEFYLAHIDKRTAEFKQFLTEEIKNPSIKVPPRSVEIKLRLNPDTYHRLQAKVDKKDAAVLYYWRQADGPGRFDAACHQFRACLQALNDQMYQEIQEHLRVAVNNILANAGYRFLNPDGPCFQKDVTVDTPIMWTYFWHPDESIELDGAEALMDSPDARFVMAHNGWVMEGDTSCDFASEKSQVYIRRELIPWGDSVKLNYGDSPKANPFLWEHMAQYTELTARIFHGCRLDNCHSTPLHLAQYMMDRARSIRPDFYVIAELFTSQEHTDNIFVNKLGITALVREAMSAGDSHEEGRLVYRFGGIPVGSFKQPKFRPLLPTVAGAVMYDITHDNPSMIEQRSEYDLLPSSALILWADCASGTTRCFDEAVPHNVDVVKETRVYGKWGTDVTDKVALVSAKASLNRLHQWLSREGFTEIFVDQVTADVVTVTRHCPKDHRSAIMIVHTAFQRPTSYSIRTTRPLPIEGDIVEILFEGSTVFKEEKSKHKRDKEVINGLSDLVIEHREHITVADSQIVKLAASGNELLFENFPPGSAFAVLVAPSKQAQTAITTIEKATSAVGEMQTMISKLNYEDINWLLYRTDQEERVSIENGGVYNIPEHGSLNYAGLQGIMSLLADIRPHNDLGHPLCNNLRHGDWFGEYMCTRLLHNEGTKELGTWLLNNIVKRLRDIPHYLKPSFLDLIINSVYTMVLELSWQRVGVPKASSLARGLAMCSFQFSGAVSNAKLPPLSKNLNPSKTTCSGKGNSYENCPTLAAGFPHFSEGIWRNWGRDTFISLPGLLLCCSRWDEARQLILGYAGCMRHGLIPNLLGTAFSESHGGVGPRYNARDAVWFWMAAIRSYIERAPDGDSILTDPVLRMYPREVEDNVSNGKVEVPKSLSQLLHSAVEMPLHQVLQESLQRHASGDIDFLEWGGGPGLDEHMHMEGFHVSAHIDWMTGFPVGGNGRNCGTWMDKMGSSDWANNRGVPATPRDGSAVELVGLCYYVIEFLERLHAKGTYPHSGVEQNDGKLVSWGEWKALLKQNFEERFWIPADANDVELRINRGIYRDSVGSSNRYTDNQFRPNFLVTMTLASDLFTPSKAWRALQRVRTEMLGPLGMRTLHPADFAFRGYYNNADDSADMHIAHGFNYHQGPEWLWPVGYYLRALLNFSMMDGIDQSDTIPHVQSVLCRHQEALFSSHWRSLPELTNANGQHCAHSCMAQAWSAGTLMEALNALLLM